MVENMRRSSRHSGLERIPCDDEKMMIYPPGLYADSALSLALEVGSTADAAISIGMTADVSRYLTDLLFRPFLDTASRKTLAGCALKIRVSLECSW